jgi:hypothetical protein
MLRLAIMTPVEEFRRKRLDYETAGSMQLISKTFFTVVLIISVCHRTANAQEVPLFPQPLFSDSPMSQQLDADMRSRQVVTANPVVKPVTNSAVDDEMRRQMRNVSRYLQLYGIRNGGRFPGFQNDEMQAARVQLTELVPNNPYSFNSQVFAEPWSEDQAAQHVGRIRLQMDLSLTRGIVDNWSTNPPNDWYAAPGTITAIGNNQGLFIVWGAGQDGRPVKNPSSGRTMIMSGTTSGTVNDQSAPNPGNSGT